MRALRLALPAVAFVAALSSVLLVFGFAAATRPTHDAPRPTTGEPDAGIASVAAPHRMPEGGTLSASAKDAAGKPVVGLTRFPGSVSVAYSEKRANGLAVARAGYPAEGRPGAVRDFYADAFRAGGWTMANIEYRGGEWYLLAARGGQEAVVEVASRGGRSRVCVEVSRPLAGFQEGGSTGGSKR